MKQTAVEWFADRIKSDKIFNFQNVLNQAKEMEEEQIKDSYCDGRLSVINKKIISAEQYYNETYESNT
jgi:hypothetical protein